MESSLRESTISFFARRTASSSLGSVASTASAESGIAGDGSASTLANARPRAAMRAPRRVVRIVLPPQGPVLRRLAPHEPAALELGTRLRLVQPQRLPRHRPERLAHGAARVAPILPGLPSDRPVHAEAVREIGAHGVEARVDRGPDVLELDLEEVLLREAVVEALIGVRPVPRPPLRHGALDAFHHAPEARPIRLNDEQPAVDAAGHILIRAQLEHLRWHRTT